MAKIPRQNLMAKIMAVIMAIVLWFFVMNEQNPAIEAGFTVPLEARNLAAGYVVDKGVEKVRVKVRAPRTVVAAVSGKDFGAYVDLSQIGEGKHSVKIYATLPHGVELIEITPGSVVLQVDKVVSRYMAIELSFSGSAAKGVGIGKAAPDVTQVRLEGPRNLVNSVDKVIGYVNLNGRSEPFSAKLPLIAIDADGKEVGGLKIIPALVNVKMTLYKEIAKKTVSVKLNVGSDLPAGYHLESIKATPAQVEVSGEPDLVVPIEALYTDTISLADAVENKDKEIKLQVPEGVQAAHNTVTVHIDVAKQP